MAVICCLGLSCSVPKAVQIEDTKPAIATDKQSVPKAVQIEDTTPALATDKQPAKNKEVQYDASQMDPHSKWES